MEDDGGLAGVAGDAVADCSCGVLPQAVATASRGGRPGGIAARRRFHGLLRDAAATLPPSAAGSTHA